MVFNGYKNSTTTHTIQVTQVSVLGSEVLSQVKRGLKSKRLLKYILERMGYLYLILGSGTRGVWIS